MNQDDLLSKCGRILGVEGLAPEDDFFGVGGNSLDAVEISEMLSRELNRDVDMDTVLSSPTFADMMKALGQ